MLRKLRQAYENLPVLPEAVFMLSLSEKILLTDFLASRGVKVFWIEHDRVGRWLTGNPWLGALKAASAHATIVCVSELSRQKYLALGFDAGRTIAIPNGIPLPEVFQPEREAGATLTVGSVARLSPEKGLDVLIHSIAEIPEVTLRIVGKGPQESFLRSMIAEDAARIGIPRITLQSTVPNLDLFYAALDVFVLASTAHDPFGLTDGAVHFDLVGQWHWLRRTTLTRDSATPAPGYPVAYTSIPIGGSILVLGGQWTVEY